MHLTARLGGDSGFWGDWTPPKFCKPGSYAMGYKIRIENPQHSGDDTGANAVELQCRDSLFGNPQYLKPHNGFWGNWHSANCSNSFLTGFQGRVESKQEKGDDTAMNAISMRCAGSSKPLTAHNGLYGSWGSVKSCPKGSLINGIEVRVERKQGTGDDTSLNDVRFYCTPALSKAKDFIKSALPKVVVSQSSIAHGGDPKRAIDDNTDGNYWNNSVTHTEEEENPWWQLDLGANKTILQITIHNRTDCCGDRLAGARVFVSETPFPTTDFVETTRSTPFPFTLPNENVREYIVPIIPLRRGRYIRIQLPSKQALSLAEVVVTTAE